LSIEIEAGRQDPLSALSVHFPEKTWLTRSLVQASTSVE
jgi:hypothetical protein